jgi:hypothetical protein
MLFDGVPLLLDLHPARPFLAWSLVQPNPRATDTQPRRVALTGDPLDQLAVRPKGFAQRNNLARQRFSSRILPCQTRLSRSSPASDRSGHARAEPYRPGVGEQFATMW